MTETIQMTYAGERLTSKETLAHAWVDGDEVRLFKKPLIRFARVGTTYEVEVERDGDSLSAVLDQAAEKVGEVDETERLLYETEQAADRRRHAGMQQRKRDKDESLFRDTLLPLRVVLHGKNINRRDAMVTAIIAELWRPLTKQEREEAGL